MFAFQRNSAKSVTKLTLVFFIFSIFTPWLNQVQASEIVLPQPTQLVNFSGSYQYPVLKGLRLDPQNPLRINFIVDAADAKELSKDEASVLIKYFLAALTIPESDLWVNLSPYEPDRITPNKFSATDAGKDLLGQDYILKQLMASVTYPESDTGKTYWQTTYQQIAKIAGTTKVPVDTFNKVWIMPDGPSVYESKDGLALIASAKLKVMLEADYLALNQTKDQRQTTSDKRQMINDNSIQQVASQVMREKILPLIETEVNQGKNFAQLRQIYSAVILGLWFKKKFKQSFYQYYFDQNKVSGIDTADPKAKEQIYQNYVQAFEKGVYDYVKTEKDLGSNKTLKRRYFSGGCKLGGEIANSPTEPNGIGSSPNAVVAVLSSSNGDRRFSEAKLTLRGLLIGMKVNLRKFTLPEGKSREVHDYADLMNLLDHEIKVVNEATKISDLRKSVFFPSSLTSHIPVKEGSKELKEVSLQTPAILLYELLRPLRAIQSLPFKSSKYLKEAVDYERKAIVDQLNGDLKAYYNKLMEEVSLNGNGNKPAEKSANSSASPVENTQKIYFKTIIDLVQTIVREYRRGVITENTAETRIRSLVEGMTPGEYLCNAYQESPFLKFEVGMLKSINLKRPSLEKGDLPLTIAQSWFDDLPSQEAFKLLIKQYGLPRTRQEEFLYHSMAINMVNSDLADLQNNARVLSLNSLYRNESSWSKEGNVNKYAKETMELFNQERAKISGSEADKSKGQAAASPATRTIDDPKKIEDDGFPKTENNPNGIDDIEHNPNGNGFGDDKQEVGGIDLNASTITAAENSQIMNIAPFDVKEFSGFDFEIVEIKKSDRI